MEGFNKNEELKEEVESKFRQEIFSKAVRAGKRTYFFDVKSTRKDEYYLTITESKKRYEDEGKFHFEKHKIFLYKEDFEKFIEGINEAIDYITTKQPAGETVDLSGDKSDLNTVFDLDEPKDKILSKDYTSVEFDDLNN